VSLDDETSLTKRLHQAILERDLAACAQLLDDGADPDARTVWRGQPPISVAILLDFVDIVLLLLERGASPNATKPERAVPLVDAANRGSIEICEALLRNGARVDDTYGSAKTALFLAAEKANVDLCPLLIAHGANARAVTESGSTPMRVAAINPSESTPAVLRLLVQAGAQPAALSTNSELRYDDGPLTAFQCAVSYGRTGNVAFMTEEWGEDPDQQTVEGKSMLDLASSDATRDLIRAAITQRLVSASIGHSSLPSAATMDGPVGQTETRSQEAFAAL
jgi:ankyrin repeat protein